MTTHIAIFHWFLGLTGRCAPIHQPELRIDNPFNSLLLSADVELSSLSSGEAIGLLQVALYVGPGSLKAPSQLLGPEFSCAVEDEVMLSLKLRGECSMSRTGLSLLIFFQ